MIHWFQKKNKSANIVIEVTKNDLTINGYEVQLPTHLEVLEKILGRSTQIKSQIHWKELGIFTNPVSPSKINHIEFNVAYNAMSVTSKAEQKPFFTGKIIADGKNVMNRSFKKMKGRMYEVSSFTYTGDRLPCIIGITYNKIYDKRIVRKEVPKDKYVIKPLAEEQIEFEDFGFKLAVIQELMYHQELLKPMFKLSEFVDLYDKRKIDLEEEGYYPILEVTNYFKELPIPKRLASAVTEIYQDGGNKIYLNLLRFGEGWEEYWDIESVGDARQFPKLKKATLCYAKKNIVDELNAMGIDAAWI